MKRYWMEYRDRWSRVEPMTYWVHRPVDGRPFYEAEHFDPPAPPPVPGKGWPVYFVELDGFTFRFSSLAELDACVEALSQKVLPTTIRLSAEHGGGRGPNGHWLSRLPEGAKSWKYRQKAVAYLAEARQHFVKETARTA